MTPNGLQIAAHLYEMNVKRKRGKLLLEVLVSLFLFSTQVITINTRKCISFNLNNVQKH